ncbi:MAG TPA: hypothetical protein PKA58_15715 [Polyangium sp.]|nr:hypothetical protein [Polyangium sp.]
MLDSNRMHVLRQLGLHPLVAFAMIVVDLMLIAADLATVATVSVAVALILTIPCILLQRYAYKDEWGVAVGKGMIVGILTAIPTPLPSIVTGVGGVAGAIGMFADRKTPPQLSPADSKSESKPT